MDPFVTGDRIQNFFGPISSVMPFSFNAVELSV